MQVTLVMFKADGTRRDFPLQKSRTVVGRVSSCDLRIPLTSVSRKHCEIVIEGDTITVRDLGSSNGTFLNNARIQEATASAGDELVIGPVVFTVVVDGEPKELEPVRTIVQSAANGASVVTTRGEGHIGAQDAQATIHDSPTPKPKPPSKAAAEESAIELDDPLAALDALSKDSDDSGNMHLLLDEEEKKES